MKVVRLDWDSDFFGYEVGSASDFSYSVQDLEGVENAPYQLIYLGLDQAEPKLPNHFFLADEKLVLCKSIQTDHTYLVDSNIVELTENSDKLLSLALQSGLYSRFKVDPNFKENEFERMYAKWVENSLNGKQHQKVLGFVEENGLLGFITITEKSGVLHIGLIAVDEAARGKGIGSVLLNWVFNYATLHGFKQVNVVTQAANSGALNFYEQHGFEIISRTFLYHVWKLN